MTADRLIGPYDLDLKTIREMKRQLTSTALKSNRPSYAQVALSYIRLEFADTCQEIIQATKDMDPSTVIVISNGKCSVLTDEDGCVLGFK